MVSGFAHSYMHYNTLTDCVAHADFQWQRHFCKSSTFTNDLHNSFTKLQHAGMSISLLLGRVECIVLPVCSCDCNDRVMCARPHCQHTVPEYLSFYQAGDTESKLQSQAHFVFLWQVTTGNGDMGSIEGSFGKSGKFKVQFPKGISIPASGSNTIQLTFKKFVFDKDKKHMAQ